MPALLLTGFEPFDGGKVNPSGEVARRLDGARIGAATVIGRVLPVSFEWLPALITALVADTKPDVMIGMGLAAGEPMIRLEQFAINRAHSDRADNDGYAPDEQPLDRAGPAAHIATLPLGPLVGRLRAAGIPARLSFHAGTHCCNLWLYHAIGALERADRRIACAFIHLPCLPEQALATPTASLPLDLMVEAVRLVATGAIGQT